MPFLVLRPPILNRRHLLPVMAAASVALIACQARAAEVVARVAGADVTVEEVQRYVETLASQDQAAMAKDSALLSQVVRAYLGRQAVLRGTGEEVRAAALREGAAQSSSRPSRDRALIGIGLAPARIVPFGRGSTGRL